MSKLQSGRFYKDTEMSDREGHSGAPSPVHTESTTDRMAELLQFLMEDRRKREELAEDDSVQKSSVANKNDDSSTMSAENERARDKWNCCKACLQVYTNKENRQSNEQRKTEM